MIERETRKRKENKERQPKKKNAQKCLKGLHREKGLTPSLPSSVGTFHTIPPKMDSFSRSASLIKKKTKLLKFIFPKLSHSDDVFLSLARLSGVWLFAFRFISFTPNCHHLTTYNTASQCTQVRVKKADTIIHKHGYFNPFCWCFKTATSSDHP